MGLNLKNEETCRLAREVAALTGQSMTAAVETALRERLERLRGEVGGGMAVRLLAIGRDCAARLPDHVRVLDHGEMLYDRQGLPR